MRRWPQPVAEPQERGDRQARHQRTMGLHAPCHASGLRAEVSTFAKEQRRTGTHLLGLLKCNRPVRPTLIPKLNAVADGAAVKAVVMPPVRILHRHLELRIISWRSYVLTCTSCGKTPCLHVSIAPPADELVGRQGSSYAEYGTEHQEGVAHGEWHLGAGQQPCSDFGRAEGRHCSSSVCAQIPCSMHARQAAGTPGPALAG